jgi:hypothetical protein
MRHAGGRLALEVAVPRRQIKGKVLAPVGPCTLLLACLDILLNGETVHIQWLISKVGIKTLLGRSG